MFEDWLEQEQATLASLSHQEGNVDTLEKTLQQLQVVILLNFVCHVIFMNRECTNVRESILMLLCTLIHTADIRALSRLKQKSLTPGLFGNRTTSDSSVTLFLCYSPLIPLIAPAGSMLKWPVFALLCADQQRASNPLGYTTDRGPRPGHRSERVGGLPGSSGGDSGPTELHTDQTEADGPKVPEPGPVAGGNGEGGKHQTSSEVRQSQQGDSAKETPGKRETWFLQKGLKSILNMCS